MFCFLYVKGFCHALSMLSFEEIPSVGFPLSEAYLCKVTKTQHINRS